MRRPITGRLQGEFYLLVWMLMLAGLTYGKPAATGSWRENSLPFRPLNLASMGDKFWVCGADEMIAESADSGATWQIKHQKADGEVLLNISFISDKAGYAAGTNGLLLWTKDGGQTWAASNSGSQTVRQISFADELHGLRVVGPAVESTANGGGSWEEVSALKSEEKIRPFSEILSIAALDSKHSAISLHQPQGENIFVITKDGGKSWKPVHLDNTFAGRLFVHDGAYWAFGIEYLDRQNHGGYSAPVALHSMDGESWVHGVRAPAEFKDCAPQGCYLWDGALVDLYHDKAQFWSLPQDRSLTFKWAAVNQTVCTVGDALRCAAATSAKQPPERPEARGQMMIPLDVAAPPATDDCLICDLNPILNGAIDTPFRGRLDLDFMTRKDGSVSEAHVANAPDAKTKAAVETIAQSWLLTPAHQDGRTIEAQHRVQLDLQCFVNPFHSSATLGTTCLLMPAGVRVVRHAQ